MILAVLINQILNFQATLFGHQTWAINSKNSTTTLGRWRHMLKNHTWPTQRHPKNINSIHSNTQISPAGLKVKQLRLFVWVWGISAEWGLRLEESFTPSQPYTDTIIIRNDIAWAWPFIPLLRESTVRVCFYYKYDRKDILGIVPLFNVPHPFN